MHSDSVSTPMTCTDTGTRQQTQDLLSKIESPLNGEYVKALVHGAIDSLRLVRRIVHETRAMRPYACVEHSPGAAAQSDEALLAAASNIGTPIFHPVGALFFSMRLVGTYRTDSLLLSSLCRTLRHCKDGSAYRPARCRITIATRTRRPRAASRRCERHAHHHLWQHGGADNGNC